RSYFSRGDQWRLNLRDTYYSCRAFLGRLTIVPQNIPDWFPRLDRNDPLIVASMDSLPLGNRKPRDFVLFKLFGSRREGTTIFSIQHWMLAIIAALPAALCVPSYMRRARRRRLGLCLMCGYDLRASKERCPECGTAIPAGSFEKAG